MERRQFIGTASALAVGLLASASQSSVASSGKNENSKPKGKASSILIQSPNILKVLPPFAEMAWMCAAKGELCEQHCDEQLANGSAEFSECSMAVKQMIVICQSVAKLASLKSIRLGEVLDSCTAACQVCKEACEEHKSHWAHGMHMECKSCGEHCEKIIKEVAKLKALISAG